ncbi:ABC-three component system protein [Nocardia sp. BMG51109]|uniref:ABC-three component system protein n=1 Tax=Nocardia sp. BMG51109 TaxID=1056816 RepID=UPI0004650F0D|nr:ABC-three component system protein [Nocardia sp. BMG51109]
MFLNEISASDHRFKTLYFREGLNILLADRTARSEQGESRNSSGKTSFVKILRYLFGGELPPEFKAAELTEHCFHAQLTLPASTSTGQEEVSVDRAVSPSSKVQVHGWSATVGETKMKVDEWRELLSRRVFRIPEGVARPTVGQLWAQLIRTSFLNPIKGHQAEPDWESGVKLGFMLGLSPEILGKAGELDRLTKQSKAIRKAVQEGALAHLSLDESALRAGVATARRRRDRMREDLRAFKVDDRYADHQREADRLSADIRRRNEEGLALQRRQRELEDTLRDEMVSAVNDSLTAKLDRVYAEIGVALPDTVTRRYEDVAAFHQSVVRNRRLFLEQELEAVRSRLAVIDRERRVLDARRAQVMRLLSETVALDTFLSAQRDLAEREAEVADIERRLDAAQSITMINDTIKLKTAELVAAVRAETHDRSDQLDESIALFGELGAEIYTDREASLLVSPSPKGILTVEPQISGDASSGIRSVEIFMLDMVCTVAAIKAGRGPRILVHDSHLFDSIDGRQVASCLNIGARLADEVGFQYIVTLNSDFLASVEAQSDGAFDSGPYVLGTHLTDETETGGLFGFRFG